MCEKQRKMSERSSLFPILYSFRVYIFIDLPKAVKHHSVWEITAESRYHRAEIRAVRETERNPSIYKNPADFGLRDLRIFCRLKIRRHRVPFADLRTLFFMSNGNALFFPRHICTEVRNLKGASLIRYGKLRKKCNGGPLCCLVDVQARAVRRSRSRE